jgi:hypothetical protein
MKKIALTLAAVASLGVAACSGSNNEAGNNASDVNTTVSETGTDLNASVNDAAAIDATNTALTTDANATMNATDTGATMNAADTGANTAGNAAE